MSRVPTGVLIVPIVRPAVAVVRVICLTDPAVAASWAAEPARRRLEVEFGDDVADHLRHGRAGPRVHGLRPRRRRAVLDAAASSRHARGLRLWLGGAAGRAPSSSYPACLAVKAAAEQGLDGPVLRRLREGFLVDRRPLDTTDALLAAVRGVPGLDLDRFAVDLRSNAIVEAFGADLDLARERARPLPSWRVGDHWLQGETASPPCATPRWRRAPRPGGRCPPSGEAVRRLARVATAEVAAACDLPGPRGLGRALAAGVRVARAPRARPRRRALARRLGGGEELARVGELGPEPGPQPRVELGGAALGDPDGLAGLRRVSPST